VADFNGDGNPDIAATDYGKDYFLTHGTTSGIMPA
jgi:hypothetical protein